MSRLSVRALAVSLALTAATLLGAPPAGAALTSSEKGQIKDFLSTAHVENATKVRSLIARTDLAPEESIAALTDAVVFIPFTEQRGLFLKELVFGGASAPSRGVLALATVKALVARAESIHQKYVGGLDHEPKAIAELVAIYGYIDSAIANAGKPTATTHDSSAGIPVATYEECSKVLREHVEKNPRWLKGDGNLPDSVIPLRAQAQVALVDMLPDGLTRYVDAADRLALGGARKKMLVQWGILLADGGKLDDARLGRLADMLGRLPGVRSDLSIIDFAEAGPGSAAANLKARGQIVHVSPAGEPYPFEDAAPASYDPRLGAVVHEVAVAAATRALDNRWSQLRLQADRDTVALGGDRSKMLGRPHAPSVEHIVGAAVHAMLVDAPKALDVAVARADKGSTESLALFSDALGVLLVTAVGDREPKPGDAARIDLGKDAGNAATAATKIRLAPNQTVVGFTLEGHAWSIDRASPSYVILSVRKDGKPAANIATRPPAPDAGKTTKK